MKKHLIIFSFVLCIFNSSFADMTQEEFYGTINSCVTNLNDSLNAINQIQGNLTNLRNFVDAQSTPDNISSAVKRQLLWNLDGEISYLNTPYSLLWDTRSVLMNLPYPSSSSVDMGVITNIYNVLANDQNNMQTVLVDIFNDLSDILNEIQLSSGSTNTVDFTQILTALDRIRLSVQYVDSSLSTLMEAVWDLSNNVLSIVGEQTQEIAGFHNDFMILFMEWKQYVSNLNIRASLDYGVISNFFGKPNSKYQFDRFSSKLRPTNHGNSIDFTFRGPYDSIANINAANFSALLAGGFSNGLIELASINNYLWFVEKFLTTNQIDNAKINQSLYSLSNMVGRIDTYVTEDFSNEFFNLCRTIEGLTNSVNSLNGVLTNSNNNLILTNIQLSLETIITNQLKSLTFYSVFSNDFNTVISNQTLFTDYLFKSDNVLTDYQGGSYYDFLTNRYINGSSSSPSNWYERVETLLAALTFSAVSQSNLTSEVEGADDTKQQFENLLTQAVNQNGQTSLIKTLNDSQGSIVQMARGLSSTIANVATSYSLVIGWGENETVQFDDFVGGNFHITLSGHGVDQFTAAVRAVTTICWIVVTIILVFKFVLWMVHIGYKLYTFIRSVLFALWGK